MGLIESSQLTDLADIQQLFDSVTDRNISEEEALQGIDLSKYLKVIYLAVIGVNPNMQLTYEEFTQLYHEPNFKIIETYTNLVLAAFTEGANQFAEGFKKSTKKK